LVPSHYLAYYFYSMPLVLDRAMSSSAHSSQILKKSLICSEKTHSPIASILVFQLIWQFTPLAD
jgi:hypothetical protein